MPVEESIILGISIPWREEVSKEELFALQIQQLECQPGDIEFVAQ